MLHALCTPFSIVSSRFTVATPVISMPKVEYSLDNAIASFFSSSVTSATREQCDEFARREIGDAIQAAQLQGMASYTVIYVMAGEKVMQFREEGNKVEDNMLALALKAHPSVVASHALHGPIGGSKEEKPLSVYSMPKLPGRNYIFIRSSLADDLQLQLATVKSLARYVSSSAS